jgi:hypothetical protein
MIGAVSRRMNGEAFTLYRAAQASDDPNLFQRVSSCSRNLGDGLRRGLLHSAQ